MRKNICGIDVIILQSGGEGKYKEGTVEFTAKNKESNAGVCNTPIRIECGFRPRVAILHRKTGTYYGSGLLINDDDNTFIGYNIGNPSVTGMYDVTLYSSSIDDTGLNIALGYYQDLGTYTYHIAG